MDVVGGEVLDDEIVYDGVKESGEVEIRFDREV